MTRKKNAVILNAEGDTPPEVSEGELFRELELELAKDLGTELALDDEELVLIFSLGLC